MRYHYIINKVRACKRRLPFSLGLAVLCTLSACQSDWRNGIESQWSDEQIAFTGSVVSSRMTTRADGSLVNLNELSLPTTADRTYYRYNPDNGLVEPTTQKYQVGIFGCYTGQNEWADLVDKKNDGTLTDDYKEAYSANLLYNAPADIGSDGSLTYNPLRFWPNNKLASPATGHEYCTFWGYYPYNPTASPGTYGISITSSDIGEGTGMGRVNFTMHPDAAQQNDFMISELVTDCNRDKYPLVATSTTAYSPKPVQLRFHHMLAQVRLYAFIRGTDKLVYQVDGNGDPVYYNEGQTYTDAWGKGHTVTAAEAGKIPVIDEANSIRWYREETTDVTGNRKRADITYKMEFNNIKTAATFFPEYNVDGSVSIGYTDATTLGSATVNHYIMNPYWFKFYPSDYEEESKRGERYMLNDNYMYGWFEDTKGYKAEDATTEDGWNWSGKTGNILGYQLINENAQCAEDLNGESAKHYNYPPGNILMVVPQALSDDDVPHIVITATGNRGVWNSTTNQWEKGDPVTAKVTINLLQMNLRWDSGFIYSYAFVDELQPGDDIVRGPESITTVFDTEKWTDQW